MPIRQTRPRKEDGLRKFIPMLYERPTLKFLKGCEPWEPIADLIFGPPTSRPSSEEIERLKLLWRELREDILAEASRRNHRPWGVRFDRRGLRDC
jgi:hypothetical protein